MDIWIVSALFVGFLGSFHCAGMCGPIAMALPAHSKGMSSLLIGRLLYNGGRIMTYTLLGFAIGLAGHTISIAGYQKPLSIATGALVLVTLFLPFLFKKVDVLSKFSSLYTSGIKDKFRTLFGKKSKITLLGIGIMNGFLPCGFVYLAMAAAITSGSVSDSALYMTFFGLGTVPMMLALSLLGKFGNPDWRIFFNKLSPVLTFSVGVLLIVRGVMVDSQSCCH